VDDRGDGARRASRPDEEALRLHRFYRGKVQVAPKCPVRSGDFAHWYTPGVAAPCRAIEAAPDEVFDLTNKANSVPVVSDLDPQVRSPW